MRSMSDSCCLGGGVVVGRLVGWLVRGRVGLIIEDRNTSIDGGIGVLNT